MSTPDILYTNFANAEYQQTLREDSAKSREALSEEERREIDLALCEALKRAQEIAVISDLIGRGADVNYTDAEDNTPLMFATEAYYSKPFVFKLLLAAGAIVNKANLEGFTPLHYAARFAGHQALETLIAAGANIEANGCGWTPLIEAIRDCNVKTATDLIKAGAKVNFDDLSPLNEALKEYYQFEDEFEHEFLEIILALVNAGVNINFCDKGEHGTTALFMCASLLEVDVAKILIAAGADLNQTISEGFTALDRALTHLPKDGRNSSRKIRTIHKGLEHSTKEEQAQLKKELIQSLLFCGAKTSYQDDMDRARSLAFQEHPRDETQIQQEIKILQLQQQLTSLKGDESLSQKKIDLIVITLRNHPDQFAHIVRSFREAHLLKQLPNELETPIASFNFRSPFPFLSKKEEAIVLSKIRTLATMTESRIEANKRLYASDKKEFGGGVGVAAAEGASATAGLETKDDSSIEVKKRGRVESEESSEEFPKATPDVPEATPSSPAGESVKRKQQRTAE